MNPGDGVAHRFYPFIEIFPDDPGLRERRSVFVKIMEQINDIADANQPLRVIRVRDPSKARPPASYKSKMVGCGTRTAAP